MGTRQAAIIFLHKSFQRSYWYASIFLDIGKENGELLFSIIRFNQSDYFIKGSRWKGITPSHKDFVEIEIFGMYVHAQVTHDESDLSWTLFLEIIFERVAKERVGKDLCPVEAFFFIDANAAINEMSYIRANIYWLRNDDFSIQNFILEALHIVLGESPGNFSDHLLIQDDSKGPNIAFVGISFFLDNLGSHVGRSSHNCF